MGWCDESGSPGPWQDLDSFVLRSGLEPGPPCLEQTTGGVHSSHSAHYEGRARDYGAPGVDHVAIARLFTPLAVGRDYLIEELFCEEAGIRWSHGSLSNFHDNPNHTHVALRPGAKLPLEGEDDMGWQVVVVPPKTNIPIGLPPPGGGASGTGYADPVYWSISADNFGETPLHVRAYTYPAGTGDIYEDAKVNTGRSVVGLAHQGAQMLSVTNQGSKNITVLIEWSRP